MDTNIRARIKPRARYSNGRWMIFNGTGKQDATVCIVAQRFKDAYEGYLQTQGRAA